jgi:hypothetical protein
MGSIFNKAHRPFAIPLLAFERFSELRQQLTNEAKVLESVVIPTLVECCSIVDPTEQDIEYFLERLERVGKEANSLSDAPKPSYARTLGSAYAGALRKLDTAGLILYMCAYDFNKANYVYTKLDRDIALEMVDSFLELKAQENNLLFESCLYGFGGKYTTDGEAEVVDLDLSNDNDIAQLAQIFARH